MTEKSNLAKATFQQIRWNSEGTPENKDASGAATRPFDVQFNPQTLKVAYSNKKAGGNQPSGSSIQFVGKGTTKLSLELVFDTTRGETNGPANPTSVHTLTDKVLALMKPSPRPPSPKKAKTKKKGGKGKKSKAPTFVPPGVRFQWGSFLFEGVIDSLDETLEYFSSQGVPLRATMSLTLSKQDLDFRRLAGRAEGPGTSLFEQAAAGDSVDRMAERNGNPDWKPVAAAHGIENSRRVEPGTPINTDGSSPFPSSNSLDVPDDLGL